MALSYAELAYAIEKIEDIIFLDSTDPEPLWHIRAVLFREREAIEHEDRRIVSEMLGSSPTRQDRLRCWGA